MNKTILVTGSGGLIGSETVRFYASKGFKVIGIDNDLRSFFFGPSASTSENVKNLIDTFNVFYSHNSFDLRDYDKVQNIFKSYKFDLIVHTAAQPSHDWAAKNPRLDFDVNANVTLNLLENYRSFCPEAVFIFTSTNKVYGDKPNFLDLNEYETRWDLKSNNIFFDGIDESMSIDQSVHSLFGVSKVSADLLVQEYGRYFGLATGVFRGGCLTGPVHASAELHGFLAYVVKAVVSGQKYKIYGYKGKQVRDNIHSADVVEMFNYFFENPKQNAVYNIGGGRSNSISVVEALNKVAEISDIDANYEYIEKPRIGDHIWYVTNFSRFKKDFPAWNLKYSLNSILNELVREISIRK